MDCPGRQPQVLAEGAVHRPAGQRRGQERSSAAVTALVSGENVDPVRLTVPALQSCRSKLAPPSSRCGRTAVRGCCPSSFTPSSSTTLTAPGESRSPPTFRNSSVFAAEGLRPPVGPRRLSIVTRVSQTLVLFNLVLRANEISGVTRREFVINVFFPPESDTSCPGLHDKNSLRTMLAVLDYLRHQQRQASTDRFALCL